MSDVFLSLNTLNRPSLTEDDTYIFYDWVLIRRKGIELGFVDSEYQNAGLRSLWGRGELILSQVYFYAGFDDIQRYPGELPFGISWSDNRDDVLAKLSQFKSTHHSYVNDAWDVPGYRLTVCYTGNDRHVDRVLCRLLPVPLLARQEAAFPSLEVLCASFGASIT